MKNDGKKKRWLWELCRAPRSVCGRVNGDCDKCNAIEKKIALERRSKENEKDIGSRTNK